MLSPARAETDNKRQEVDRTVSTISDGSELSCSQTLNLANCRKKNIDQLLRTLLLNEHHTLVQSRYR